MSQFSTLYQAPSRPLTNDADGGQVADALQHPAGGTWCHGAPGTAVPESATRVLRDGSTAWTWGEIADELADAERAVITPHRWNEELTDAGFDATRWPLLIA